MRRKKLPIISSTNDVFTVKAYASNEFFVALEDAQAGAALNVPESDGVVAATANDQPVPVLQTRDATLVSVESAYELAARRIPDFDSPIATR